MKYWIIGFTPETYKVVQEKKMIGVRKNIWKRFSEVMSVGDKFIGYLSKLVLFDSLGTIESEATFEEDFAFHPEKLYPGRRQISFEKIGLKKPAMNLFWAMKPFNEINTVPGNYIMCLGGFVEISKIDFDWILSELKIHC